MKFGLFTVVYHYFAFLSYFFNHSTLNIQHLFLLSYIKK